MAAAADRPLAECAAGDRFEIARVIDQSPDFLRHLSHMGLAIGARGSLVQNDDAQERLTIRLGASEQTLERKVAAKLMVH
jgi:Fe2+ transport system protein FeoA